MSASEAPVAPGAALEALAARSDEPSRQELYRKLPTAWVFVPLAGAPAGLQPGVHLVRQAFSARVRFWHAAPDGPPYLPVFFTQSRLEAFAASAWGLRANHFLSLPGRELLALDHPESLAGCVLDPGGSHIAVGRQEMADLAAGQLPGALARLLVAAELDPESRARALALLPAYRLHVIVGAEVATPDALGLVVFRRPGGGASLPVFTTPGPLREFAERWGLVQADGNISTDCLSGADLLAAAARHGWWLGVDPGARHQAFFAPEELR